MSEIDITPNQIILGNNLNILKTIPDNSIDLTITSPPYNKAQKGKGGMVPYVEYDVYDDSQPEDLYQYNQIEVINQIYRITKPGHSFFYNHKCRWDKGNMIHPIYWLAKTKWMIKQEIIWDRIMATNLRGWRFWQTDERIYWLYKPTEKDFIGKELASQDAKMSSVWREVPAHNSQHPAPFPLWLPLRIITAMFRNENDKLILDPYMGSGTTAVATSFLKHNYLGIEISENYQLLAQQRIKNKYSELKELHKELNKHTIQQKFSL